MIRLGIRLALAGGREALTRLALIAIAVAIGVGLLLATLAGLHAVNTQNARYAWLETGFGGSDAPPAAASGSAGSAHDPLWWELRADYFQGQQIGRIDLAATGPASPLPPGMATLPAPGEYYASPAMVALLHRTPAAQLGDRYPGHLVGTIGSTALPSPDSLIIVIGRRVADLSGHPRAELVNSISTTVPSSCNGAGCAIGVGIDNNGIVLILVVVTAALLFPVLVFIGSATRLSAARREQRFAAMRLVGATPQQTAVISTVESTGATVVGVAGGFGLFFLARPAIATIPFTGDRFFTGDLSPTIFDIVLLALGIPIAAAVAARLGLRRVNISPLGVVRRVTPGPPSAARVIPLIAGIGELAYFAYARNIGAGTHTNTTYEAVVYLAGVLLVMAGLVIAGPWLTMLGTRLFVRWARRPATLIAGRRLADNPKAAFRAISGVVLAVFVGTASIAIIAAISVGSVKTGGLGDAAGSTLIDQVGHGPDDPRAVTSTDAVTTALRTTAGVTGMAVIRDQPVTVPPPQIVPGGPAAPPGSRSVPPPQPGFAPVEEVVSCADLATVPALGHCPAGAAVVSISPDYAGSFGLAPPRPMRTTTWMPADVSLAGLQKLSIDSLIVATDGSAGAVERARTVLDQADFTAFAAQTGVEIQGDGRRLLDDYRRLADVVILTSLPIAGCSLAVSVAGGLIERKRPFSLLRLAGAPTRVLHRVVGLEAAAPLLVTAAISVGAGFVTAHLFLRAQLRQPLVTPGVAYYIVLATGLLASLAVVASTLPLLNRITGPETARNE